MQNNKKTEFSLHSLKFGDVPYQ